MIEQVGGIQLRSLRSLRDTPLTLARKEYAKKRTTTI